MKILTLTCATAGLVAALLTFSTTAVWAQPDDDHRHGDRQRDRPSLEQRIEKLSERLDLTQEQSAQMLEIMQSAETERKALRDLHEEAARQDFCLLRNNLLSEAGEVLTADQSAEFAEILDRLARHRSDRRGHGRRGGPELDCGDEAV